MSEAKSSPSSSSTNPQTREASIEWWAALLLSARRRGEESVTALKRWLCRNDLFFLLVQALGRRDLNRDWLFARIREVEAAPDGYLDLWAREHGKSSIITLGLTIKDILNDPEVTFGFFSFNRPVAKAFLRQIKQEFESNDTLKRLFPEILWANPRSEAPKWSEDEGIVVRRRGNPKEATIEAWGLVDGQPTSKHFRRLVYDDVVTIDSVTTPEMIKKVTTAWELSRNLGVEGGASRHIGTRYHFNDTYQAIMARGAAKPRIYPATADGTDAGEPVLMSRETLAQKRREMGPHTFGCQMLLDPAADKAQGFNGEWLRYYKHHQEGEGMNRYILVDPASQKKKDSDYTAMMVVGLGSDQNYYILDMIRDRLRLTERADALFSLHRRWKPKGVGYERYGLQADIEHIKDRQNRENYRFSVIELGGQMPKPDRIKRLVPIAEQNRLWLPETCHKHNYEGNLQDLVHVFVEEEYKAFPVGLHEDMLDALARICDAEMQLIWPMAEPVGDDRYKPMAPGRGGRTWQSG